jgi:preprotein translocase subunit SecE
VSQTSGVTAAPERGRPRADDGSPRGPRGWYARFALFLRQVVAELRKVVWPTRNQLLTYTGVVLVFVLVIMGLVALFDLGFSQLTLKVFGN